MGYISSSSYGHKLNGGVGLSMIESSTMPITKDVMNQGQSEIELLENVIHAMYQYDHFMGVLMNVYECNKFPYTLNNVYVSETKN